MGRTSYWMNVSLDGYIEYAAGEEGGGSWMSIDEQLHEVFNTRARELTIAVEGRVIYETMEHFWPAAIDDESLPAVMREYGEIWTSTPKILVSRTRTDANYNTRIFGGDDEDAMEQLAKLRTETDGLIGVGGANVATQLLERGLLDELMLFVHPAMLGSGRPLFDRLEQPLVLELLEHETYHNGVAMHRYAITHDT